MKIVSVIIPVYNVEKYIKECIESIINQTYSNLDIIIINDGSTDNSLEICKNYENIDKRIKVVDQINQGVSIARNKGLSLIKGEYVAFVDGDDILDGNFIKKMVANIRDNDMCICGYREYYKNKDFICVPQQGKKTSDEIKLKIFTDRSYGGYVCNKIFKTNIIRDNDLKFDYNLTMQEDKKFVINYLEHCKNIYVLEEALYSYRMRKSSAVWNIDEKKKKSFIDSYEEMLLLCKDENSLINSVKYDYVIELLKFNAFDKKNRKHIKYYRDVTENCENWKRKIKIYIFKYFSYIYKLYITFKLKIYKRFE